MAREPWRDQPRTVGQRVEWSNGGGFSAADLRGAVVRTTASTAWVKPDATMAGVVRGKHDKFRPLTEYELQIERWLAAMPHGGRWMTAHLTREGDITVRIEFNRAADKASELPKLRAMVEAFEVWISDRPARPARVS